jgi:Family of unknown function (DUF5946)
LADWTTCPGCGVDLPANDWVPRVRGGASAECQELLAEVQGFELAHLALVRDHHQMTVDAYAAQHVTAVPGPAALQPAYGLVGLHLALDHGVPGVEVRAAHQRMGRPDGTWPVLAPPARRGEVTVFDVATAGLVAGSEEGHAAAVTDWARSVWTAWEPAQEAVAALTLRLGLLG